MLGFSKIPEGINPPALLTQETMLLDNSDNSDNPPFQDKEHANIASTNSMSTYEQIVPLAKELANVFGDISSQEEEILINNVMNSMNTAIVNRRCQLSKQSSSHNIGGQYVSVCAFSNKRLKTHGTKHM
jgi:hypothetical protein